MSFLNPLYLLAALAALVPLIIHLLHRQRARIEIFPSLEFLRRMMRKRTRRFHLKQILLLLVRILILLLIALALAGPTLMRGRVVKGHLPTTAVIILDDSYSMQQRSGSERLFEVAKRKALALLDYFERSDQVEILTASRPSRALDDNKTSNLERLRERLDEHTCTNLMTDIAGPLRRAVTFLGESRNPNREIYIISDMQGVGWEELEGGLEGEGLSIKVLLVDLGDDQTNACVKDIGFRIPAGSDDMEMDVVFERFNLDLAQGRVAEVFLRGTLIDRSVFSSGDISQETESFRLPEIEGYVWGEVVMAEDRLVVDDRRFFALPSRRRVIGIVGNDYYLRTALSPEGGGGFEPVMIEEGAVNRANLARLDVLICANVARFSALEIEAIADYLAGGGSLLIFLGDMVDTGSYNRSLLPRLGSVTIEGLARGGDAGFFTIEGVDRSHRIFAKFRSDTSPFSEARFYDFMKMGAGGAHVIASFSDGSPAMVEVSDQVIVLASAADVAWNDFVLTSQFLPIMHETLLYLSSRTRLSQAYLLGDEIVVRGRLGESEVTLEGPTGAIRYYPEMVGRAGSYRIESPDVPGLYFLKADTETLSVFALNVDTRESDLTKVSLDRVAAMLGDFEVKHTSAGDDIGESVALLRRGRDLARGLLWVALALILLETLLASNIALRFRQTQEEDAFTHS